MAAGRNPGNGDLAAADPEERGGRRRHQNHAP